MDMSSQTSTIVLKPVEVSIELRILYRFECIFTFKRMVITVYVLQNT